MKKQYFKTRKEANASAKEQNFYTNSVFVYKVKGGRHKGKYRVCSYLDWLNSDY